VDEQAENLRLEWLQFLDKDAASQPFVAGDRRLACDAGAARGVGSVLIRQLADYECGGGAEFAYRPEGFQCRLVIRRATADRAKL
jgi:hypothetical protein